MEKPAKTSADIHPIIKRRWSPRSFDSKKVEKDTLEKLFEAARWAPSSFNEQPWRFITGIKGDESYDKIYECLVPFNKRWSYLAPMLVITVGKTHFSKTGKYNRVFQFDVGQSVAYITFQAYSLGMVIHQMAGLNLEKTKQIFNIPEGFEPITAFAAGYQGAPEKLPEDIQKSEKGSRSRKPIEELVFKDEFGKSFFN